MCIHLPYLQPMRHHKTSLNLQFFRHIQGSYFEQVSKTLQHLEGLGFFLLRPTTLTADFMMAILPEAHCWARKAPVKNQQQLFFIKLHYLQ